MPPPVIRPRRAQISCIAAIMGKVNTIVQSIDIPNCVPTCEYVATPLGSSSAAPVTNPGPRRRISSVPDALDAFVFVGAFSPSVDSLTGKPSFLKRFGSSRSLIDWTLHDERIASACSVLHAEEKKPFGSRE